MNTNYKKDFVPHEPSLALKELGFDEPCFGWYSKDGTFYEGKMTIHQGLLSAPLYQQALRWFRKPENGSYNHLDFMYEYLKDDSITYEEAELACLNKLIEIVKQKHHATTN